MSKGLASIIQRLGDTVALLKTPCKSAADVLAIIEQAEPYAPPIAGEATREAYVSYKRSLEEAAASDVVLFGDDQPPHPDLPALEATLAAAKALEAHRTSTYKPRMSSEEYVVWAECDGQLEAEFCSLASAMNEQMEARSREDADEASMIRRLRGATREVRRKGD